MDKVEMEKLEKALKGIEVLQNFEGHSLSGGLLDELTLSDDIFEALKITKKYLISQIEGEKKMLSEREIAKIIELYNEPSTCPIDGSKVSWETFKNHQAHAIYVAQRRGE